MTEDQTEDQILSLDDMEPIELIEEGESEQEAACNHLGEEDPHDPEDVQEDVEFDPALSDGPAEALPSLNGFTASSNAARIGVRTYRVPGTEVRVPLRSEVAPLLLAFMHEFHHRVERLRPGWCWGWAYRPVRGGSAISFHSPGIAVDLNAPRHPLGRRGTFTPAQVRVINLLAKKYGLRWGGNYRRRADEMHFEIIVSRSQALAIVRRIQAARR